MASTESGLTETVRSRLHEKIDGGNEGVTRDLGMIADAMYDWEGGVAEALGLTPTDIAAIRMKHSTELKLQTRAALQLWQEKNGSAATYQSLIEVFKLAGKANYADTVYDVLKKHQAGATLTAVTPLPQTTVEPQPIVVKGKSYGRTELAVLKKNEDNIKYSFADLVSKVLAMLTNLPADIDMDVFRTFMSNLFPGILQRIPSSGSISDFFTYISDHQLWSYTNHSPVESVAKKYLSADPQMEELIEKYESELAGYYATNSLVDYIALCKEYERVHGKAVPAIILDDDYFEKISLKLEIPFSDETLEYVSTLWKSLARRFLLPTVTALLYRVVEGSLVITWCIPHHFAMKIREFITKAEVVEFLCDKHISEVKLGEEVWYDVKTCLLGACKSGDIDKAMKLLQDVDDFNFTEYEDTPLGAASYYGHSELAKRLLHHGCDIEGRDEHGFTPLLDASIDGQTDVMELLLATGANVNATNNNGWTPLIYASSNNQLQVVQLLLKKHVDVNARDERGTTALMEASREGYVELAKVLLEGGADPNIADEDGSTALILASRKGHFELVKILLEGGADPNIADDDGWTPLKCASYNNHLQVVQLLLKHHVDVNAREEDGFTALMLASRDGHVELVKVLLKGGADPNIADEINNWTAMFFVCDKSYYQIFSYESCLEIVHLLINHGADVDFRDKSGVSASDVALTNNFQEIADIIIQHSHSKHQNTINEETRRRVRTAGDYFRALFDFFLPELAKKREGLLKEEEGRKREGEVKAVSEKSSKSRGGWWSRFRRRRTNDPTIPTQ